MGDYNFSIMSDIDIDNLFDDTPEQPEEKVEESPKENQQEEKETTESINPDELFSEDDNSESVGSGKEDNEEKGKPSPTEEGTSPNSNFYSSIAKAFEEDGVFPDLSSDDINNISDAESLRACIDKQIQAGLEEKQKRIDEALGVGVEPNQIRQYENTMNYINSITEDNLSEEGEKGENLRKNLIYQDFINRGYSKERAEKEVRKSFDAGTDIEDAKDALEGNKEYFQGQYDKLIADAKAKTEKEEKERKKQAEDLKKSILDDDKVFGDLSVDKSTRKKIFESISKPVYKDPDSGNYLTAIQKYESENRLEFLKNVGLIFTLTDGFKNLDGLIKGKVKKEVRKGISNLESTLNNTSRNSDGSLNFAGNRDGESLFKGYSLDI